MTCICGNPSKGTDIVTYYTKKDGSTSRYVHKEKRCQSCINRASRKSRLNLEKQTSEFIGY